VLYSLYLEYPSEYFLRRSRSSNQSLIFLPNCEIASLVYQMMRDLNNKVVLVRDISTFHLLNVKKLRCCAFLMHGSSQIFEKSVMIVKHLFSLKARLSNTPDEKDDHHVRLLRFAFALKLALLRNLHRGVAMAPSGVGDLFILLLVRL
jgi:hypothetical protein